MRTTVAGLMTLVSAAAILAAGVAAAGASPAGQTADGGRSQLARPPHALSSRSRIERLHIVSTRATSRRLSVIATGVFTAGGTDRPGKTIDVIRTPRGTFQFRHVSKAFAAGFGARTCLITETVKGTFTLSHGTGMYAGIKGSGKFVTRIRAVATKDLAGRCTHVQAPATFQGITTAIGTARI